MRSLETVVALQEVLVVVHMPPWYTDHCSLVHIEAAFGHYASFVVDVGPYAQEPFEASLMEVAAVVVVEAASVSCSSAERLLKVEEVLEPHLVLSLWKWHHPDSGHWPRLLLSLFEPESFAEDDLHEKRSWKGRHDSAELLLWHHLEMVRMSLYPRGS
jgi:hypothetical protein